MFVKEKVKQKKTAVAFAVARVVPSRFFICWHPTANWDSQLPC